MNFAGVLVILLCLCVTACSRDNPNVLTIAAAANTRFVVDELIRSFTEQTGISCEAVIGSSGKLTAQIAQGAPFDVLIAADLKYPTELYKSGLTTAEPEIYAYGKLALWSMADTLSIDLLTSESIRHVALANPSTAPYGRAAVQVLQRLAIYERITNKLVFGENIAQTSQFIASGAADIGFTAKAVVLSQGMHNKGSWKEIDPTMYAPLAQGAVILKTRKNQQANALAFYQFLFSGRGRQILQTFGYDVDNK